MSEEKYTYQDKCKIVDEELCKRRNKWYLHSLGWFDFQDVEQIIRAHLAKKWDQWDQERPLRPWLNKIISNQMKNILRNNYTSFAKPCINCPFNQGSSASDNESFAEGFCSFTESGTQCAECPLYAKWEKRKKAAYEVKMPLSMESHSHEVYSTPDTAFDFTTAENKLHKAMKKVLNSRQYDIYNMLFIKHMDEDDVAKKLGYKTTEKGRKAGYKQIKNLKKQFKEKAAKILKNSDIIIF